MQRQDSGNGRTFVMAILSTLTAVCLCAADPPDKKKELKFDPKLSLKWPGEFSESSYVENSDIGELKHYSAMGSVKKAHGVIIFSAFVEEYPEKAVKDKSAKQMLNAY